MENQVHINPTLTDSEIIYSTTKTRIVGYPLAKSMDFFKQIFAYILGFQWALPALISSKVPNMNINLPTLMYSAGYAADFVSINARKYFPGPSMYRQPYTFDPSLYQVSGFDYGTIKYNVNPFNFLFVGLNFLARNIGKFVGALLVCPFTIPAFIAIKLYFTVKIFCEKNLPPQDRSDIESSFVSSEDKLDEAKTLGSNIVLQATSEQNSLKTSRQHSSSLNFFGLGPSSNLNFHTIQNDIGHTGSKIPSS